MMRSFIIVLAGMLAGGVSAQLADGIYAEFDTSMGSFTCRLDYAEAPLTCANFIGLAEGTQPWIDPGDGAVRNDPFYSNRIFHRVIDGFMIQGGCPLGNGTSGPGYAFPDEFVPTSAHYAAAGTVVMANSGPDSNGSQFFVTVVPNPSLDPSKYMVFGDVVDGIGVVTNIGAVATTVDRPDVDVVMNQVQILRIGTDAEGFDVSAQPLPEVSPLDLALHQTPIDMMLEVPLTNQLEVLIHSSTNLMDWIFFSREYWPIGSNYVSMAISTESHQGFYRGARVFYPQAVSDLPALKAGDSLSFTQGLDEVSIAPLAGGLGSAVTYGTSNNVVYWEWKMEPYMARLIFQTSSYDVYRFELREGHAADGYRGVWNGSFWEWPSLGSWNYSYTPVP